MPLIFLCRVSENTKTFNLNVFFLLLQVAVIRIEVINTDRKASEMR